jgi:hypothetical protein
MHASLAELFEAIPQGLLWVMRDGTVRHATGPATTRTGLSAGRKLWDPDLVRAVADVLRTGSPAAVEATGVAPAGGSSPTLKCRVLPGLGRDDVFVMVDSDSASDGAALRKMMQVIDSDLRAPVKESVAQLATWARHSPDPQVQPTLDALQHLTAAMDTLLDLARIWQAGALMSDERIELWPLLQQVWQDAEPLASERKTTVRFKAAQSPDSLAPLYGNPSWLRRVMRECLEAAIRSSRPGGTLHIEHHQNGPHALVIFRDSGVFAGRQSDAVAMPTSQRKPAAGTAAAAARRLSARDQLGLELCRHVLALHGGQLREEDEDGLRSFLLELPTGAPFRPVATAIDAAQIQQYAHDLAELMARSRLRKKPGPAAAPTTTPTTGATA